MFNLHHTVDHSHDSQNQYLPEAAHPYYELKDDFEIVFASPKGGKAPLDPVSVDMFKGDELCTKFLKDEEVILSSPLSSRILDLTLTLGQEWIRTYRQIIDCKS